MSRAWLRARSGQAFVALFAADFVARAAYQAGKTPLLPIFADRLGASAIFLGMIVSVSTMTGLVLKPAFGFLSDRTGRWLWLAVGTAFFIGPPFLYAWVETPQELFLLRLVHGLATAIYGPVTLAYVAEITSHRTSEGMGWFGLARSGAYVVGPVLGGMLLTAMEPEYVFMMTGGIALAAFVPVAVLRSARPPGAPSTEGKAMKGWRREIADVIVSLGGNTPLILVGAFEMVLYVAVYALKAFLPLYALASGHTVLEAGVFFSVQEMVNAVLRPGAGRLGDRLGHRRVMGAGLILVGASLVATPTILGSSLWLGLAMTLGAGQAIVIPSALALIARHAPAHLVGTAFGVLGTLRNGGKVLGPVIGGLLLASFDPWLAFTLLGALPVTCGLGMITLGWARERAAGMATAAMVPIAGRGLGSEGRIR